jgi:hypothetical protein
MIIFLRDRRDGSGQHRFPLVPVLFGAVLAACTVATVVPVRGVKDLAGLWDGWIDNGRGGYYSVIVTIKEDGSYEVMGSSGATRTGSIDISLGEIRWDDASGAGGPMRLYETDGKRVLRGSRADGSVPFEWTQRK